MFIKAMKEKLEGWIEDLKFNFSQSESGSYTTKILAPLAVILIIMLAFGIYWSEEPEAFDVIAVAAKNV
ncbi:MAG: hypothetical protein ACI845_000066, partial [Gammaproteobacteria bacterium]